MNKVVGKITEIRRSLYLTRQHRLYPLDGVSIISQNCLGGVLYHRQGARFLSPTINCAIRGESFVNLCENLETHLLTRAIPAGTSSMPINGETQFDYPLISIGSSVIIDAVHYPSHEVALQKWNERKDRVNYSMIIILANTWDLHNDKALINRLLATVYPIIIFTDIPEYKKHPGFVYLGGGFKRNNRGVPEPLLISESKNKFQLIVEQKFDIYRRIFDLIHRKPAQ